MEGGMQLSFKMFMISLVLFLSDVCVHLNAASNQNLLLEDDDSDAIEGTTSVVISGRWLNTPENTRNKYLSVSREVVF
jgi:hypothetical protein